MSREDGERPTRWVRPSLSGRSDDWSRLEEREYKRFESQRDAVEHWRATMLEWRAKLQAMRDQNLRLMALRRRLTAEGKERDRRPPGFLLRPHARPDGGKGGMTDAP